LLESLTVNESVALVLASIPASSDKEAADEAVLNKALRKIFFAIKNLNAFFYGELCYTKNTAVSSRQFKMHDFAGE
jgi:hypothetical protein